MPKPSRKPSDDLGPVDGAGRLPPIGIFGPDWHRWRGATLHITLEDEPPFMARLDKMQVSGRARVAHLTELDAQGRPITQRRLPWPPSGTVRVLRAP